MLSSDDPVRVYQQFATLDLISRGRAEIMAGRGSFISPSRCSAMTSTITTSCSQRNSISCFRSEPSPWSRGKAVIARRSRARASIRARCNSRCRVWIASGGTSQSVARAGALGLPLAIAIIGGEPARFAPLAELYREAGRRAGVAPDKLLVGINGHGFLADTTEAAVDAFFAPYAEVMSRIGRERGWPPLSRAQFDQGRGQRGHLMVGTPDEAIAKILAQHEVFRHDRNLMQMSVGDQPQDRHPALDRASGHGRRAQGARGAREAEGFRLKTGNNAIELGLVGAVHSPSIDGRPLWSPYGPRRRARAERGWPPLSCAQFDQGCGPRGH